MLESTQNYQAPLTQNWQGRVDSDAKERMHQYVRLVDLNRVNLATLNAGYALIGFCCDEGVKRNQGRGGARLGPAAIRQSLCSLALYKHTIPIYDVGDIVCEDGDLETAQQDLAEVIQALLTQGMKPVVLGGGHELAYGHYLGIAKAFSQEKIGIINFDAHFDLRPLLPEARGSSGTPFTQIANYAQKRQREFDYFVIGIQAAANTQSLFRRARDLNVTYCLAESVDNKAELYAELDVFIQRNEKIYLSFCLDVLAHAFAPGVSAPQPFGLIPAQVLPIYNYILASGKVLSFDVAELAPPHDCDNTTAKLAAGFVWRYLLES